MSASWINKLNESNSRLHKEDVVRQALASAKLGDRYADFFLRMSGKCYNPFVVFGVKAVPISNTDPEIPVPILEFNETYETVLKELETRVITGNAARDALLRLVAQINKDEWNSFYGPVLKKDLRAGISRITFNKILKGTEYEIPEFSCQLASSSDARPEMQGVKRISTKLDGNRLLLFVFSKSGAPETIAYSRNGKVFENFKHIENQIRLQYDTLRANSKYPSMLGRNGFVLDGEIMSENFQALMKQSRRKKDADASDSIFNIFDIIPVEAFLEGHWNMSQQNRDSLLKKMFANPELTPNCQLVPYIDVNLDTEEGQEQYHNFCQLQVKEGKEGAMIKDLSAPYICDRSTNWLKWKPIADFDLKIVSVEPGKGKHLGRMGAFVCEGIDNGKFISVHVGSGFTDEQRIDFWNNRDKLLGQMVVVTADAISKNQNGTYSLRFPRWKTFRDDKD